YTPASGLQAVVTGNLYDVLKDKMYTSTATIPVARTGGSGQATIVGRTGWKALDAKFGFRANESWLAFHAPSFGWHYDDYFTLSNQYNLANWRIPASRINLASGNGGETCTHALYAQDVWSFAGSWSLTPGVRWESWRAFAGYREKDFNGV